MFNQKEFMTYLSLAENFGKEQNLLKMDDFLSGTNIFELINHFGINFSSDLDQNVWKNVFLNTKFYLNLNFHHNLHITNKNENFKEKCFNLYHLYQNKFKYILQNKIALQFDSCRKIISTFQISDCDYLFILFKDVRDPNFGIFVFSTAEDFQIKSSSPKSFQDPKFIIEMSNILNTKDKFQLSNKYFNQPSEFDSNFDKEYIINCHKTPYLPNDLKTIVHGNIMYIFRQESVQIYDWVFEKTLNEVMLSLKNPRDFDKYDIINFFHIGDIFYIYVKWFNEMDDDLLFQILIINNAFKKVIFEQEYETDENIFWQTDFNSKKQSIAILQPNEKSIQVLDSLYQSHESTQVEPIVFENINNINCNKIFIHSTCEKIKCIMFDGYRTLNFRNYGKNFDDNCILSEKKDDMKLINPNILALYKSDIRTLTLFDINNKIENKFVLSAMPLARVGKNRHHIWKKMFPVANNPHCCIVRNAMNHLSIIHF